MFEISERKPKSALSDWMRENHARAKEAVKSGENLGAFEPARESLNAVILVHADGESDRRRFSIEQHFVKEFVALHPSLMPEDIKRWSGKIKVGVRAALEVNLLANAFIDGAREAADNLLAQGPEAVEAFRKAMPQQGRGR